MSLAGRLGLFILKLAVLIPLLYWGWSLVQPSYSATITALANLLLGLEEWGVRVTRLASSGALINMWSALRTDGQPAGSFDAKVLHFYIVPSIAIVLAFPSLAWRRRLPILGAVIIFMVCFHVLALVVQVEFTYAVSMALVAARNYSPAEAAVYDWLRSAFVYLAIQALPASILVFLVAISGGIAGLTAGAAGMDSLSERGKEAGMHTPDFWKVRSRVADRSRASRNRSLAAAALLVVLSTLLYGGCRHLRKVNYRQSEKLCVDGYAELEAGGNERALELFRLSVHLKPTFPDAHAGLGYSQLRTSDAAGAAEAFAEALRLNPAETTWIDGHAKALAYSGRPAEAMRLLTDSIGRAPDATYLRLTLAEMMAATGRACEAITILERLLLEMGDSHESEQASRMLPRVRRQCTPWR